MGLVRESSPGNIVFSPPLVISRDEADEALDLLHGVLADVGRAG